MSQTFLSTFTPSAMSPETLKAIFVQRHKLVDHLIELVEDSSTSENKHFRLLIGMRGIGKTHTIALLYHRIREITELQDKLLISWLKEEEWGVSSWLDLLLRIFQALNKEYPQQYKKQLEAEVNNLYQLSLEEATNQAENILKEFLADKTLLLLTENLDEIFNGLGDLGQKQFRAFLQNYNLVTIIATSQSLFNGVSDKDAAFYGFFATEYLNKLTIEEATNLLTKIAELQQDKELENFIQSPTGKDRIKAIHHLAGGNHRVYIIFSQFLTRESLDELIPAVMKVLDELTPYYQARMQWLSPQQRKIIELLCETRNPIAVKEIARKSFITHQTASSQLKDLRKKGYVATVADIPTGRESYYELQEPLMRICLEVKKQRGKPIKLFIEFLRIWYTEEELQQRLEILPQDCLEREYIDQVLTIKTSLYISSEYNKYSNSNYYLDRGIDKSINGDHKEALMFFHKALKDNINNDYAWINRGLSLIKLKEYREAIISYNKALAIDVNSYLAWHHLGFIFKTVNDYDQAIKCYEKSIEIEPNYYMSWNSKGLLLIGIGKYQAAIDSYDKALEIESNYHLAWNNRGLALNNLGKYQAAIDSYDKALEVEPNYHLAWNNRGWALNNLGKYQAAIDSYDKALEIEPNYHLAWNNRGITLCNMYQMEEATISFRQAIKLRTDYNRARFNLGYALYKSGYYKDSIISYNKVIVSDLNFSYAYFDRVEPILKLNRWNEGFKDLDDALNRFQDAEDSYKGDTKEYIKIIWESTTDIAVWKSRLQTLVEIYAQHELVSELNKGITNHIPTLLSDMVSDQAARSWLEIWQEIAGDKPELLIALRFLKTAVEYKETKGDRKVLLQLATEERSLFEELLAKLPS